MNKKIYFIGIGGIGISAIARYYLEKGYQVFGSDKTNSELIQKLKKEGANIIVGEKKSRIDKSFDFIIYTEAIPEEQIELKKAKELKILLYTYPEALAQIANKEKLISVAGTHGKSTTTSLISLILKNSNEDFTSIVGTLLKEFDGKNFYHRKSPHPNPLPLQVGPRAFPKGEGTGNIEKGYFVIEACEYKRSFLAYKPTVGIITNIEIDHLDYYKDLDDYILAYKQYIDNIVPGGFLIINGQDKNCQRLKNYRQNISVIEIFNDYFLHNGQKYLFPNIDIKIPGRHILFDAKISYIVGFLIGIEKDNILKSLNVYNGVWRRMEQVGQTINFNILISDYGHHPTEISLTLEAIKKDNVDKKILTIFQPHQYNRTLELLDEFKTCFGDTDILIIPNIYESRDTETEMQKIDSKKLVELINHPDKHDGDGFENTLKLIKKYDEKYRNELIIILLGAGNIDDLRYKIILQ